MIRLAMAEPQTTLMHVTKATSQERKTVIDEDNHNRSFMVLKYRCSMVRKTGRPGSNVSKPLPKEGAGAKRTSLTTSYQNYKLKRVNLYSHSLLKKH